jgi:hypothetical protein
MRGCSTAEAKTKEFAIQTYCVAPPISSVIRGSAVAIIVTSRADIKESILKATMIIQNLGVCRISGVKAVTLVSVLNGPAVGGVFSTIVEESQRLVEMLNGKFAGRNSEDLRNGM